MNLWAVVDVGCIECGEATTVVGVYDSVASAEAARDEYAAKLGYRRDNSGSWDTGGSFRLDVLPIGEHTT